MPKYFHISHRGYTLIEVLVSIAIMAILVGLLLAAVALALPFLAERTPSRLALALFAAFLMWSGCTLGFGLSPFHSEERLACWIAAFAACCAFAVAGVSRKQIPLTLRVQG